MTRSISEWTKQEYATCDIEQTARVSVEHSWGVSDSKGRAIGARVMTFETTYTENDQADSARICQVEMLGHWFGFRTDALRAGQPFGPGGNGGKFKTEAERAKAIEKFLKGSKVRALKEAAK